MSIDGAGVFYIVNIFYYSLKFHFVGHYGLIKFPFTILHPYYISEVAQILNKICPGCKSLRVDKVKVRYYTPITEPKCVWLMRKL